MSNTDLIIEQRSRDIGDFLVGRYIPFRKKRMVGPFIFIDHMGLSIIKSGAYLDVDQHPHIGLSTLTYLLEGSITHSDSLGTHIDIQPGSVNWMTAGKGVTHTERTPQSHRDGREYQLDGYQIWVALPKELEETPPAFQHVAAHELPTWREGTAQLKLIAGQGFGRQSPVEVHSPLYMVEIKTEEVFELNIAGELEGELGIVVHKGHVMACGQSISEGNMLVSKSDDACSLQVGEHTHLFIFGGKPLPEERFIAWNFVSHSKEKLAEAKELWRKKNFQKYPAIQAILLFLNQ